MSILDILEKIGSDTKRNHKLALIEIHQHNPLFMRVVKLALDPYINFFIKQIPEHTSHLFEENKTYKSLDWALDELNRLTSREFTGNAGISHLSNILSAVSTDDQTVITRIIGKDLRCGMADGIVNAVAKGFIPTYPCLLARPYDSKNIKNISYPAYSQLKGDGVRGNVIVENGKVSICGRSGRPIELLGCLDDAFVELASHFNYPVVFDGELLVIDINGNPLSRKVGNGIINKAIKGTISEEEANMVQIMLWDAIPLDEFRQGKSAQRYDNRFPLLESALNLINQTQPSVVRKLSRLNKKFTIVPYKIVDNLEQATDHFHELLGQGFEGTILKDKCGYWEDSRSKYLVKMKAEKTCDLELIGYNPGEGKFTGMVGSLIFTSSDRKIEVSVSGFSDLLRQEITDKIDSLIGAIGEIIYNERITSQDKNRSGVDSLFLPRFGCFRNDKFIADSTNEIT